MDGERGGRRNAASAPRGSKLGLVEVGLEARLEDIERIGEESCSHAADAGGEVVRPVLGRRERELDVRAGDHVWKLRGNLEVLGR